MESDDGGDIIRNEHLVRYQMAAKFVNNKKVLDIACGSGYGTRILAQAGGSEVVGMDRDPEAIRRNMALPYSSLDNSGSNKENKAVPCSYKVGSATDIPARDKEFDLAVSFETIEHLAAIDQDKFVSELARVVSDEGLVFISTPNREVFGNKNPYHINELNQKDFESILKKHFPFVKILEQGNGVVSFIKSKEDKEIRSAEITSVSAPLYFVAVCSKKEDNNIYEGVGSVSVKALERLKNNPVMKLSDKIYPLIKFFFKK